MAKIRIACLIALVCVLGWKAASPERVELAPRGAWAETGPETPAPPAVKIEKAAPSAGKIAEPSKLSPWSGLLERVRALEETDQPGLDRLYDEASEKIRADEPGALRAIADSYPSLLESSLEESFFVVNAWMRASHSPAALLRVIWAHAPAEVRASGDHHAPMSPLERQRRIEAHALRELRARVTEGKLALQPAEKTALIAELTSRAGKTPSLNVGLEAFQLLSALGASSAIETALQTRPAEERELIAQVLESSS